MKYLACGVGTMVALMAMSAQSATYVYDPATNGGLTPTADGWTDVAGAGGIESVSGGVFFATDNSSTFAQNLYRQSAVLDPQTHWQMKARVALLNDYTGSGATGNGAIFNQLISDGDGSDTPVGSTYGFGMLYNSSLDETRIFFRGANNTSHIAVAGLLMLDITVTKTTGGNPAGRGDDPILLEVFRNGVLLGSLASTLDGGILADTTEHVEFGNFNGAPTGTFALRWATFGIGAGVAAPMPEPAGLSFIVLAAACLARRRRR